MRKVWKQSIAKVLLIAMIFSVFSVFTVYGTEDVEAEEEIVLDTDSLLEEEGPSFDMGEQGVGVFLTGASAPQYQTTSVYSARLEPLTAPGAVTVRIYPEGGSFAGGTNLTGTMTAGRGNFNYNFGSVTPGKYVIEARYIEDAGLPTEKTASHIMNITVVPRVTISGPYEQVGNTPVNFTIGVLPATAAGSLDFIVDGVSVTQLPVSTTTFAHTFTSLDDHDIRLVFTGSNGTAYEGMVVEVKTSHVTLGTSETVGTSRLNPYIINDETDWASFVSAINTGTTVGGYDGSGGGAGKYWRIVGNVFLSGPTTMVGNTPANAFKGTVDVAPGPRGEPFYIIGANVTNSTAVGGNVVAGIFGYTDGAELNGICLREFSIAATATGTDNAYAGGIVGLATGNTKIYGTIFDSDEGDPAISATSANGAAYAGGIAGSLQGELRNIDIAYIAVTAKSTGNQNDAKAYAGGIVGKLTGGSANNLNVEDSEIAAISLVEAYVGGIVGDAAGVVQNNQVHEGKVTGNGPATAVYVGGIVGNTTQSVLNNKAFYLEVEAVTPGAATPSNWGALIGKSTTVATGNIAYYKSAQTADVPYPTGAGTDNAPGYKVGLQAQAATNNAAGTRVKLLGSVLGQNLSSGGGYNTLTFFRRDDDADRVIATGTSGNFTVDNVETIIGPQTFIAAPGNVTNVHTTSGSYNLVLIEATRTVTATVTASVTIEKSVIASTETLTANVKIEPAIAASYGKVVLKIYKEGTPSTWLTTTAMSLSEAGTLKFTRTDMPAGDYTMIAEFNASGSVQSAVSAPAEFKVVAGSYFELEAPTSVQQGETFVVTASMLAPGTTSYVKFYEVFTDPPAPDKVIGGWTGNGVQIKPDGKASATVGPLAVGKHTLKAVFPGGEEATVEVTVTAKQVTIALTNPTIKTPANVPVTYTGTVKVDGNAVVGDLVELYVDGTATGVTCPLTSTGFTLTYPGFATDGTHKVSVEYKGGTYPAKTSAVIDVSVGSVITTTVVSGPSGFMFGTSGRYTATVTAANGQTPTGSIIFTVRDSSNDIVGEPRTFPLSTGGTAAWFVGGMAIGSYTLTAEYVPDDLSFRVSDDVTNFTVDNPEYQLALGAPTYSRWGEYFTLTALYPDISWLSPKKANGIVEFWAYDEHLDKHYKLGEEMMVDGYVEWTTSRWQLTVGEHELYAYFLGDGNDEYVWQKSNQVLHTVDTGDTWVRVTADGYSLIDQNITVTCWVDALWENAPGGRLVGGEYDGNGIMTGYVQFYIDGKEFGPHVPLVNGIATATINWNDLSWTVGEHVLVGRYLGNENYTEKYSEPEIYRIGRGITSLVLTPTLDSRYTDMVTFMATVSSPDREQKTGRIEFYIDGILVASRLVIAEPNQEVMTGYATFSISSLSVGNHTIHAKYLGDGNFEPSSDTIVHRVLKQYPTLTYKPNLTAMYGEPITLAVYVTGDVGATVKFYDGSTQIGQTTVVEVVEGGITYKKAWITTNALDFSVGMHDIKVEYVESASYLGGQIVGEQRVQESNASFVLTSSEPNGADVGENITFTATVYGHGVAGTVTFYNDGVPMYTQTLVANANAYGVATYTTNSLPAGVHPITAVYSGDANYTRRETKVLYQGVGIDNTDTTFTLVTKTPQYRDEVKVRATISFTAGGTNPTGTVEFYEIVGEGAEQRIIRLGSADVVSKPTPVADFVFGYYGADVDIAPGIHRIYAVYNGDSIRSSSVSEVFEFEVFKKTTKTEIEKNPLNAAKKDVPTTFRVMMTPAWSNGIVELYMDGVKIDEAAVTTGTVSFTVPGQPTGVYELEAKYLGDDYTLPSSEKRNLRVDMGKDPGTGGTGGGGSSGGNNVKPNPDPEPEEPVKKPDDEEPAAKSSIKLYIDAGNATVDGEYVALDAIPYISESSRTMVPIRFISEACGYEVHWYPDKDRTVRIVDANGSGKEIELYIGNTIASVDGKPVKLDSAPIIKDNRTFVPIRMIIETMDKLVEWDDKERIVSLIVDQPKAYNTVVMLDEYNLSTIQNYTAEDQALTYRFLEVQGQLYSNVKMRTLPKGMQVFYARRGVPRNVMITVQNASFKGEMNIQKYVKVLKYNPTTGAHEILVGEVTYDEKWDEFIITFRGDADSMYAIITTEGN